MKAVDIITARTVTTLPREAVSHRDEPQVGPFKFMPVVPLFAATLFVSSFLVFLVEPVIAKMVLPIFGGAPMVWNTCVIFFQFVMLSGYALAHTATTLLLARRHAIVIVLVYLLLLVLPFATLPFRIWLHPIVWSAHRPIGALFVMLASAIGLPFLVLSTSAPVMQKWFSATKHPSASDPYFLYAASNLGSLLALVSYPIIVEPMLRLPDQSRVWTIGYAVFVVFAGACVAVAWPTHVDGGMWSTGTEPAADEERSQPIAWSRRFKWMALAFVPSSFMLAVTSYLSSDIAAVPLLWILPLSLYLLTFVLVFRSRVGYWRLLANRLLAVLVLPVALFMAAGLGASLWYIVPLHLLTFTAAALLCHGELARDRPPPARLTEFYFWIAFGGMLGGLFNTLAAPVLFQSVAEYPLVLVLACVFRRTDRVETASPHRAGMNIVVPAALGALAAGLIAYRHHLGDSPAALLAVLALPATLALSQSRRPTRFALSVAAILLVGAVIARADSRVIHAERTFFGVYRVTLDRTGRYRELFHGTTLHGRQAVDKTQRAEPLTYFHRTGPFGQAFGRLPAISETSEVAVVGLGIGSLAAYASAGQRWTFYEIDPAVERIARNRGYFTHLDDCGDRCRVVLGDARLSLAAAQPNQYTLIVLDAFSSDAIPVHLMTAEAVSLYLTRLAPRGVLAFHLSNRHLTLAPVLARFALGHDLVAIHRVDRFSRGAWADGKEESDWLLMARDRQDLGSLVGEPAWVTPRVLDSTPVWTDDFSNILSVLSIR